MRTVTFMPNARITHMSASEDAMEISSALDQLAKQLSRHALITTLAALPNGSGATLARELAIANITLNDEKFAQVLARVPGAPGYTQPPLAMG